MELLSPVRSGGESKSGVRRGQGLAALALPGIEIRLNREGRALRVPNFLLLSSVLCLFFVSTFSLLSRSRTGVAEAEEKEKASEKGS